MPIYDFKCKCGKEKLDHMVQSFTTEVKCDCGKKMHKLLSRPNLVGFVNGSSVKR